MTPRGGRATRENQTGARHHWASSVEFELEARSAAERGHWQAAYSNAILSIIHAADAVCLFFSGQRASGQDHMEAIQLLQSLREFPAAQREAFILHFRSLVAGKTAVQYGGGTVDRTDADAALKHLDRGLRMLHELAAAAGWPTSR